MKIPRKGMLTIQQWSVWLVTACILPAAIASTLLIYHTFQRERASVERTTIETARALMQAVDRELASAQGALQALATSPSLASGDLAAFDAQAREALRHRPGNTLVLSEASGKELINTLLPFGATLPSHGNPAQLRRVFDERRPVVSDLYLGTVSRRPLISVDVPVQRGNTVAYALSMQFFAVHFADILKRQRVPADRVISIFDSAGVHVARNRAPDRFVGQPGAPALIRRIAEIPEGIVKTETLEGIPVIAAFSRSSVSSWAVAIGMPLGGIMMDLWKSLSLIVAGTALLLLIALVFARIVGHRLTRSIRALAAPALALGRGEAVVIPALGLREARDVGQALVRASELIRERTAQRDHAEQAERELFLIKQRLEQSEALQRGIFEEGPDAILVVAPSGRIVRANLEAERLFGYPRQQLLDMTVEDLAPSTVRVRHVGLRGTFFAAARRRSMGSGANLAARRADGSEFPIDVMLSPLRTAEGERVIATVRDVTERRRSEDALRASEKRFRNTLEHAPIGMAIVSLEGRWVEVNNAICEIVGYSKAELQQLTEQDITCADDRMESGAYGAELIEGKIRSYQIEKRYLRKDGQMVPVLLTGSLLRDDSGKPLHFIAQVEDITARKQAQEQLRTLHNRLALATQAGGIAVWEMDLVSRSLWCDQRMHELYKLPQDDSSTDAEKWWRRVPPEHAQRVRSEFDAAVRSSGVFATEYPIVWPDGQVRIIRANAVLTRDGTGQAVRMTGINWDVTESRQKESAIGAALREKETLLKELYHRVKNNLQVITSLFNLQVRTLPEGPAREALKEGAGRVRAMALVHEKLYQSGNLSSISLDEYIADLCNQLGNASGAEQRGIRFAFDTEPVQVGLETAVPLGLLLNELICNSLKHAFADGRRGTINVRLRRQDERTVELAVADTGVGFPAGLDLASSRSLGLKLVTALSAQLDGRLAMRNDGGARVTLGFPLARHAEAECESGAEAAA